MDQRVGMNQFDRAAGPIKRRRGSAGQIAGRVSQERPYAFTTFEYRMTHGCIQGLQCFSGVSARKLGFKKGLGSAQNGGRPFSERWSRHRQPPCGA
jgi:hypothetical protein